ncbi:MAG: PD40 domain-containing protein [Bacteroidales bacterium]|nr:PD40 domain-containing protein [Bacteroidales bacterium]
MKTLYLHIFVLIFFSYNALAQKNVDFKPENFESEEAFDEATKYLYTGDDYFDDGIEWYSLALDNYEKAYEFNPNNSELNYRMGVCNYYLNDNFKSLQLYNKAYELDPNVNEMILYRIGQGYQFRLQFDKAIEFFNQFKSAYNGKERDKRLSDADKRISECENGKKLIKNFVGGLVVNIQKINSKYTEHSPLISPDENTIYFTSRRPSNPEDVDQLGRSYEDIYVAKKDENGIWQEAVNIGDPINTKNHDATIGLSPDGLSLYIYDGKRNGGDILVSHFKDSAWTHPEALPAPINTKNQETAISFSPDGKLVYFVSNRPEGIGGKDIWVADVENGKYKNARVLSGPINTVYDERAVFIHPDGKTMYFSSEGHETMGGFDIFKSTLQSDGIWGEPKNIGYPVNTAGDDIFFVTSKDNKRGYFSSMKLNSKGEQDIYMYVFPEEDESSMDMIVVRGILRDADSKKNIPGTIVFTDTKTGKKTEIIADPETGEFLASIPKGKDYAVNVTSNGYTLLSESIHPDSNQSRDFLLSLDLNNQSQCKPIVLQNVWFDFDAATLRTESNAELDQLFDFLKGCDQYKVEISGYTCNAGDQNYNYILSQRRAQSVVDYLINKGISKDRLIAKGYGSENSIADNGTKEGRIKNRRVEFKLVN